jgi:hypothetical protein
MRLALLADSCSGGVCVSKSLKVSMASLENQQSAHAVSLGRVEEFEAPTASLENGRIVADEPLDLLEETLLRVVFEDGADDEMTFLYCWTR